MQTELTQSGPLLQPDGQLSQIGWSRHALLDCNLESARFYAMRPLQRFRIKRWDYYAVFSPRRFFSATIADLGYAGNLFVYTMDFTTGDLHEEGLVIPFGNGIQLPRNSDSGDSHFADKRLKLDFSLRPGCRHLSVAWPEFHGGRGIRAEIDLVVAPQYESMNITIPIGAKRFYYNHKMNCMPASGTVHYGDLTDQLDPATCSGSLDWGRGVWEYRSFWNWASASSRRPCRRSASPKCRRARALFFVTATAWVNNVSSSRQNRNWRSVPSKHPPNIKIPMTAAVTFPNRECPAQSAIP